MSIPSNPKEIAKTVVERLSGGRACWDRLYERMTAAKRKENAEAIEGMRSEPIERR